MSYEVFVYKFENGDAASIPMEELNNVLFGYGRIEEGHFGLEFISEVGDICEMSGVISDDKGNIIGVSFNRPTIDKILSQIIFDLLSIKNTCFFGSDLEFMQSRNDLGNNFPESLRAHFPDGPEIISKAGDSWPLK